MLAFKRSFGIIFALMKAGVVEMILLSAFENLFFCISVIIQPNPEGRMFKKRHAFPFVSILACMVLVSVLYAPQANAGPNASATVELVLASPGTNNGPGTPFAVQIFLNNLSGPIIGAELAFDLDLSKVTITSVPSAAPGLIVLGFTAKTVVFGGFPPGATPAGGFLGTVEFTSQSSDGFI